MLFCRGWSNATQTPTIIILGPKIFPGHELFERNKGFARMSPPQRNHRLVNHALEAGKALLLAAFRPQVTPIAERLLRKDLSGRTAIIPRTFSRNWTQHPALWIRAFHLMLCVEWHYREEMLLEVYNEIACRNGKTYRPDRDGNTVCRGKSD